MCSRGGEKWTWTDNLSGLILPGASTEADVRDRFGVPETIWDEADGARTLEYNRQPAGQINYMITVGADGRLVAVRQVLTPENFARITPGTDMAQVRRNLGKPAKVTPYRLSGETHHDWRFAEAPNIPKVFTVVTKDGATVLRTQIGPDMDAPENKGGR
ncbi:MAG: outer membrane protein assembly factor BamE [Acidovorax sp. 16-64-162]|nr:MAG: outer membrane protein assembly factor BamE [Acidovorax sp. 16-64-162]